MRSCSVRRSVRTRGGFSEAGPTPCALHFLPTLRVKIESKASGNVDDIVCAGIPFVQDEELKNVVPRLSICWPCGPLNNPPTVCMKDRTCLEYFPKQFVNKIAWKVTTTGKQAALPAAGDEQVIRPV